MADEYVYKISRQYLKTRLSYEIKHVKCMVRKMIKHMAVMYIFCNKRPETYE